MMTDLRSLDSAPDSNFDFEDLKRDREEESALESIDPMKLLERDYEKQKKGLPPAFGGSKASQFAKLSSEQFSLRGKAATNTMASMHAGPIKINKLEAKRDVYETPDKMEDSDTITDEEANITESPMSPRTKKMPETSEVDKPLKFIKRNSIKKKEKDKSKSKSKKVREENEPRSAFDYTQEEEKFDVQKYAAPALLKEPSSNNQDLLNEVKDLRSKIRSLESEKRALKEDSIKLKQDCSEQIHKALNASGSDDKMVEILKQTVSELETKRDRLELNLSKKDNEIEKVNRKLEDKDIDIKNMKEKAKEQQLKIVQAEDKVKQMAVEMKNFREQLGHFEQENVSLKKEINTMNLSYNRLKDENQELNSMVEKMRNQIESKRTSFKDNVSADENEFDEYKVATETLITDYKAQIRDFDKKIDDLNNDYDNLLVEKEQADKTYFSKLKSVNKDIAILQQSESNLKSTITDLEKRVDDLIQERLERERSGLDSQSEVEGKYRALEIKYKQATGKLEDREQKLKVVENKLTHLEEEKLYMMSNGESQWDTERHEYKTEIEELKDKITLLENKNDELLMEKDVIQQQLDREQNKRFDSDQVMEGNERLLTQIKKLQNQVNERDNQILSLQSETQSSSTDKKMSRSGSIRRGAGNDNRQLAEMSVENEFLKKQIEELQERIDELKGFGRDSESSDNDGYYHNLKGDGSPNDMLKTLKTENNYLSSQLIEIKTRYAESDQERNALQLKLRERNETLKKFSSEITKYEFEMIKTSQSLGEALNQNIELDQYNGELIEIIDSLKGKKKKK